MTTTELHEPADYHAEHEATHPSDLQYIKVAVFLAIITGIEVALYYVDMSTALLVTLLTPLMLLKFFGVVLWFMHLKFDSATFRRVFYFGLALAVSVYLIVLATFQFFA